MAIKTFLRGLKVSRVDLVDKGANQDGSGQGSHVLLYKRAPEQDPPPGDPSGLMAELRKGFDDLKALFKQSRPNTEEIPMPKALKDMTPEELLKHAEGLETKVVEQTTQIETLTKAAPPPDVSGDVVELKKAHDDLVAKNAQLAADLAVEREERLTKQYRERAASELPALGAAADVAPIMRAIEEKLDPEVAKSALKLLTDANTLVSQSELFKRMSRETTPEDGSPQAAFNTAIAKAMEADPKLTKEQAVAKVTDDQPSLVRALREG